MAAKAFEHEPNVHIAILNCELYKDICLEDEVVDYPGIRLFKPDETIEWYDQERTKDVIIDWINRKCGTMRREDGLLNEQAGIITDAKSLVAKFMKKPSEKLIPKMKKIVGADFYVKVMERILAKGVEATRKDAQTMENILEQRKGSPTALDGMKKRLNVFMEFLNQTELGKEL